MKKLIIIIFLCFIFSSPCYAYRFADKWSWSDTAYQGVFLVLLAADWAQTRTLADHNWFFDGKHYYETNPLLGKFPTPQELDLYNAGCALGHTLVSLALPPEAKVLGYKINPRRIWQGVWIGIEAGYVGWNYSLGVRIEF